MKVNGNRFRRKRFQHFLGLIHRAAQSRQEVRILDIGGTRDYWVALQDMWSPYPISVTIVNMEGETGDDGPFRLRLGDACNLSEYADNSFDIVHSNSVIEHVGRWEQMKMMAAEVRRLAPVYYLQTPDFAFPVEPHFRTVGFHWLPEQARAALIQRRGFGFRKKAASVEEAVTNIQSVNLLTKGQMKALFGDAVIFHERFLGLPKSLIAVRE
ncbi:hypothetical protein BSL82_16250 [Tardibacter chloracetimidivorans]|uniref:Methyltransferase type 11 domain-containing protein n=1 Tax=Tardibacter chloracetimidivorans TaxID=1921510 RepID=A0A1L3ZYH5_9SPHN|nr:class I SAM-dependent methyltransferase [Tardibacter chloracetimidivorans]API60649.1 hypothetical protein BSL82_16250 [Tardibacter chloracetimidivorans]